MAGEIAKVTDTVKTVSASVSELGKRMAKAEEAVNGTVINTPSADKTSTRKSDGTATGEGLGLIDTGLGFH